MKKKTSVLVLTGAITISNIGLNFINSRKEYYST